MGLNAKSKMTFSVIMPPDGLFDNLHTYMPDFLSYLKENCYRYAFSFHLQDKEKDGSPKRPHLHVYSEYLSCDRIGTRLNELKDVFHLGKLSVSIKVAGSEAGCVKYLIHKGWPDKFQYDKTEIVSNYDGDDLEEILNSQDNEFTFNNIVNLCHNSSTLLEVMEVIGIKMYRAYRPVIMDIWKEVKGYRS